MTAVLGRPPVEVMEGCKICSRCGEIKKTDQFFKSSVLKCGLKSNCKVCDKKFYYPKHPRAQQKWRRGNPEKMAFDCIYRNARKRGVSIGIDRKTFYSWYLESNRSCVYCGLEEMDMVRLLGRRVSIDRMDNKKGYEEGNIAFCCYRCNSLKSNFFSHSEWIEIAAKYIIPKMGRDE